MESIMQQSFQSEGSDSYRSSSSLSNNEELVEFSTQNSTELEEGVRVSRNQINTQLPQESGNLTNSDLDTMMLNYKQLGGELEHNLKILENKRLALNKTFIETKHECEILKQQKEWQKKSLVDLQIRLENLDTEKMNIWKENQKDKCEKTETIKKEMKIVLENDAYINDTYTKFIEILNTEKNKCEEFFHYTKNEKEMHKKNGEDYISEVRKANNSFKANYENMLKQESKIIEGLNAAIVSFKSLGDSRKVLQEKISEINEVLEASDRDNNVLKATISQKKVILNNLHNKHRNIEDMQENLLNKINKEIFDLQTGCQKSVEEVEERNRILTEMKQNLQFLTDENCRFGEELLNFDINNKSGNQELNQLFEECSSLKYELNCIIAELEKLEAEAEMLPELTAKLNQLDLSENELSSSVLILIEERKQLEAEVEMKRKDCDSIKLAFALSELEASKLSLAKVMEKASDVNSVLEEHRVNFENNFKEMEKELGDISHLTAENAFTVDKLEDEKNSNESNINIIKNEMETIESQLAEAEEEYGGLQLKQEELTELINEIQLIEENIATSIDELINVEMEEDGNQNLDDLESDLNKVTLQIKEAQAYYENQIETIKTSFQNQEKTCRDKANRDIAEIERKSHKEEAHESRVSLLVPRLNSEIVKLENDLKNALPDLCKEIEAGLEVLDELATFYEQIFDSKQQKGKATTIRNLTSIEEQLASPMKCLMTLEYIPKINLNPPCRDGYQQILKVLREKYTEMTKQLGTMQLSEMAIKLQEMASCLYGKKYVKPTFNQQILNETEISSSTEVYY